MNQKKNIILVICFVLLNSCFKNERKIQGNDFSKSINDTIKPKVNTSFAAAVCKIKGSTNDTVIIKFHYAERKYVGDFHDNLNMDYYGGIDVIFEFEPYKATEGNIEIEYGIY